MPSVPYQLAQGDIKTLSNPSRIAAIGGDNGTEFYIFFRDMPPGQQWVNPFTYSFMYVMDSPHFGSIEVDTTQVPPWGTPPITTSKIARITAYDTDQLPSPGITSPSLVRNQPIALRNPPIDSVVVGTVGGAALDLSGQTGSFAAILRNPGPNRIQLSTSGATGGDQVFVTLNAEDVVTITIPLSLVVLAPDGGTQNLIVVLIQY